MARLSLSLLGPFQATLDGKPITDFAMDKVRALLAYLAVEADRPHRREALAGLLWPDWPDASALTNLRNALSTLRRALGDRETAAPVVLADRETVQFNSAGDAWVDAQAFRALTEPHQPVDCLEQGIALYRGPFLEGFSLKDSAPFEEWVQVVREQLQRQCLAALARLAEHHEQRGDLDKACQVAWRQLDLAPWQEETHRQLMRLLALSGQRGAALAQYETCRHVLQTELGVEPAPETVALYERIRDGTFPDQAVAQASAPSPSASPAARPRHNLPAQLSSFIGREKEIAQVQQKLAECRLVTLTGAGGVGKTRLAIQVAREALPLYPHGVWLVELAPLADPALVPQAVMAIFGLQPDASRSPLAMLTDYFREKTALLVLDNCEHLIAACAQLAETLLTACPNLYILATSREALGIGGEASFYVPSLSLPPSEPGRLPPTEHLSDYEAVRLFVERAAGVLPGFAVTPDNATAVAQVCHRLDGIPLALELAAARVKVLRVEQIAARLEDGFQLLTGGSRTALPRHRTLRAAIDWSYELLSDEERVLLRRLSVFAGGWTLEAAEAVCAQGGQDRILPDNVLDLLTQLVNKSLVVADREPGRETRYRLLETIRQYAHEKLDESGELIAARDRHLDYFLRLAEEAAPPISKADKTWLDRLETEFDNVRAAWERSLESDVERALRLAQAVIDLRSFRGGRQEQQTWLARLLPLTEAWGISKGRAIALRLAASSARAIGDNKSARPLLEASLTVARAVGDKRELAITLRALGGLYAYYGDMSDERACLEESLTLFKEMGDIGGIGGAALGLGWLAMREGDYTLSRTLWEQSLSAYQSIDHALGVITAMLGLGSLAGRMGDYVSARTLFEQCLSASRDWDYKYGIVDALRRLGDVARCQGDYVRAGAAYAECLQLDDELMGTGQRTELIPSMGYVALHEHDFVRARALFEEGLSLSRQRGLTWSIAPGVTGLAGILAATGKPCPAAQSLGWVKADLQTRGMVWAPHDQLEYDRILAAVRAQLDEATFNAAWAQGQAMTMDEAVAYTLDAGRADV